MKQLKPRLFFAIITVLCFTNSISAQENSPGIGLMPSYTHLGENLLILDANKGEIISFASVGEPIYNATVNKEENTFYILTKTTVYKGNIADGEVIDQYKYNDIDLNDPDPMAKLKYMPVLVTKKGRAIYQYTGELDPNKTPSLPMELYVADLNTKTNSFLYDVSHRHLSVAGIAWDDKETTSMQKVSDSKNWKIIFVDIKTQEVVKEEAINKQAVLEGSPELGDYNLISFGDVYFNEDVISCMFNAPEAIGGGAVVYFNKKSNEVETFRKFDNRTDMPFLVGHNPNSDSYYFSKRVCQENPQPKVDAYDFTKPGVAEQFQKDLKKWQDEALNFDNCNVVIYDNKELTNEVVTFHKTNSAMIFNDKYAYVPRSYEIELYNMETKETVWTLDTDF